MGHTEHGRQLEARDWECVLVDGGTLLEKFAEGLGVGTGDLVRADDTTDPSKRHGSGGCGAATAGEESYVTTRPCS